MDVIAKNTRGMNKRYRVPGVYVGEEEAPKRKESQLSARGHWETVRGLLVKRFQVLLYLGKFQS